MRRKKVKSPEDYSDIDLFNMLMRACEPRHVAIYQNEFLEEVVTEGSKVAIFPHKNHMEENKDDISDLLVGLGITNQEPERMTLPDGNLVYRVIIVDRDELIDSLESNERLIDAIKDKLIKLIHIQTDYCKDSKWASLIKRECLSVTYSCDEISIRLYNDKKLSSAENRMVLKQAIGKELAEEIRLIDEYRNSHSFWAIKTDVLLNGLGINPDQLICGVSR